MKDSFAAIYLRLMKYAMLMGILGGIACFIGPSRHALIKAGIGVVVGAMIPGYRLPYALKDLFRITDEISDEIFRE